MAFNSDVLLERLRALTAGSTPRRWLVAYSGGIDSTVLLHALADSAGDTPILAIHIDHDLHPDSAAWAENARRFAGDLGVDFAARRVQIDARMPQGPEAAAREARYSALNEFVVEGDCLLSGHHESDQAETLLLNLVRGSGPAGLAGIGARQVFGRGLLLRPMLGVPGEEIAAYAEKHALRWIEDPSNKEDRFDRNFVRQEIVPRLKCRWPAVVNRLTLSSTLLDEANELLQELADIDIASCGGPAALSLAAMNALSESRQRNLLRRAIRLCGLPPPPATRLYQAVQELIPARPDAQPLIAWPGAELRRYREHIYVLPALDESPENPQRLLIANGEPVDLGNKLGSLQLVAADAPGLCPAVAGNGLQICFREGGESLRIAKDGSTRKLKKLMQEHGVLPWMRDRLPLLYAGRELVAVADLWVSADHSADRGLVVNWQEKPLIYCEHSL
ncbi:MAG: tRNA lysidine(34) synthetase TilS [Gammaproteobacteria bacterium]|nr:tRNA lysidine(34) synthetase TilS [Gammaproteobacteria bacterium]